MLHKMTPEQWNEVIFVNLASLFNMSRNVIEGMRARGYGRIINIASINGQKGQMARQLFRRQGGRHRLHQGAGAGNANRGITVNAIAPATLTPRCCRRAVRRAGEDRRRHPIGRLGGVDEIAACVAFLAREDASFITGATLTVNGGQYMAA